MDTFAKHINRRHIFKDLPNQMLVPKSDWDNYYNHYTIRVSSLSEFIEVIKGVSVIVPIDAVSICSNCLVGMNKKKESGKFSESDEKVVLALISALGAIGDKAAFDSLLAVTYYNYSDNVITAARNALARLKW